MNLKAVKASRIRTGIVGCGVVADYGHIPAVHRSPLAELVGFADPALERREAQARKYGVPCFESFEEMVASVEMDAVTIATQPAQKLEMIRVAARNGLHAFCEKPLTDSVHEAEELVGLMDEAGLFVGMAFVYRGKKVVQRMMELLREGAIGKLRVVRTKNLWDYHGLRDEELRPGRRRRALRNMGALDCGVHHLDLARYMAGADYQDISAVGTIVEAENVCPDHIIVQARMANGVLASIEESAVWGYTAAERPEYCHGYTLIGEDGLLTTTTSELEGAASLYVVSGGRQWTEDVSKAKAWDETYDQFFRVTLGRDVPNRFIADAHDALANMQIAREVIGQCGQGAA